MAAAAAAAETPGLPSPPGSECSFVNSYPEHYVVYKTDGGPPVLDGNLDDPAWAGVPWTSEFVDIASHAIPRFRTRAKIRYDDEFLYVGAELTEPEVSPTVFLVFS